MQIRALKTFNGRLGLVRAGVVITVDDRYGNQLIANGLAAKHNPDANAPQSATQPGPDANTDLGGPKSTKGEGDEGNGEDDDGAGSSDEADGEDGKSEATGSQPDPESGEADSSKAGRRGGGRARPLSSQQVARRSRKKT